MNAPLTDRSRLSALLARLEAGLLERDTAVRLALLAALAGEHVLLIGPPGTAKERAGAAPAPRLRRARYFERLLTRFSTPEELFGPLSLKALEHDRYERLVEGYLPTAGIAFLDEVFKANSAILNALLTLLNEREFDNGSAARDAADQRGGRQQRGAGRGGADGLPRPLPGARAGGGVATPDLRPCCGCPPRPAPIPAWPSPSPPELRATLAARGAMALPRGAGRRAGGCVRSRSRSPSPVSDRRWRQLVGLLRCAALTEGRARSTSTSGSRPM